MNDAFLSFVSEYFSVEKKLINKKTRIEALERTAHDRIVFTFELKNTLESNLGKRSFLNCVTWETTRHCWKKASEEGE